jgi:anti-sigma28 factor (negative regulator of flagellin synthesis)
MKVDQRYLEQAGTTRLDKPQETQSTSSGRTQTGTARSSERSDEVQLSGLSERLLDVASMDQPGHAARIARLAAEVRSGSYQTDDVETAKRLVQEATRNVVS